MLSLADDEGKGDPKGGLLTVPISIAVETSKISVAIGVSVFTTLVELALPFTKPMLLWQKFSRHNEAMINWHKLGLEKHLRISIDVTILAASIAMAIHITVDATWKLGKSVDQQHYIGLVTGAWTVKARVL